MPFIFLEDWNRRAEPESASAPESQQGAVAWMLEWTHSGDERGQRLYDDERHCLLDAESDGGVCVPLIRGNRHHPTESEIRRDALELIANQDPVEMALDPTWAKRIAAAALSQQQSGESHG